jgi:hypothetical protein
MVYEEDTKKARLIAVSFLLVFILLVIGGIVFTTSSEPSSIAKPQPSNNNSYAGLLRSQPSNNNSYAGLFRFVERLMTDTSVEKPVIILPGALPSDLPEKIPIPNDAETIGSLVRSDGYIEIILDDPQNPNKVMEFYRSSLSKAGWKEPKVSYPESGGFSSTSSMAAFCRYERKGPSLTVRAYTPDGEKPTDVRIQLDTNPQTSACTQLFNEPNLGFSTVMPVLKAPKSALQKEGGGCSSGNQWESSATLETELNVKDLEAHYRNQLVEAGWKLEDKGNSSSIAWSTWSFTDESGGHRSGILFVSELGQENLLSVMFRVHIVS